MSKRRPSFESLEDRLCMSGLPLQTSITLPSNGSWTSSIYGASPLFVDIFNTGKDDLIAVAANSRLVAYAEGPNGTAVPLLTYQVPGGVADIESTPIVVKDNLTGRLDLFAGMGRNENAQGTLEDGRVFGWDLQTGQLLPGWTSGQSTGHDVGGLSGVIGGLTSGQLEGNGQPDIVVTSFSHNVTAFRLDGSMIWQWTNDDTIVSGAVVGDIDRSGVASVVVGGDSSSSPFYQAGGWVNVLSNTGILKWRHFIPGEVTWSSPVLADLKGSGYLDIVIGTGLNYQIEGIAGAQVAGDLIYALDPFGNILPGWPYQTTSPLNPAPHEVLASPAVADLLGNGQLEVIAIDRAGTLHVIQANGQDLPGFVGGKVIAPQQNAANTPDDYASPIIADVTGGGFADIIATAGIFESAFDRYGNLIQIGTTTNFEGINTAGAVGNFDGTGALTLAFVSNNPTAQGRPDQVEIYNLPASKLAPPWPLLRRTIAGDAVARSTTFDHAYVGAAFNTVLGYIPGLSTIQGYDTLLDADTLNLLGISLSITSSPLARQAEVERIYQAFLGRVADPGGLAAYTTYLATNTYRQMEIQVASSPEFAQRAGNNLSREITQLYQAILNRTPAQSEINAWLATGQSVGSIAGIFLGSQEYINDQLIASYPLAFGPGAQNSIPADAIAAFAYDTHHGSREETMTADLLASGGEYAATNFVAGYIEDLYRDILNRDGSPTDVASWIQVIDNGSVAFGSVPGIFLNSVEARGDYIQAEFQALLGHGADSGTVANLVNYTNRENIVIFLVGSPEYFSKNGGTYASFVAAAFRDLAGIAIDQANINAYVNELSTGVTTTGVAQQIIYGGTLYFAQTSVNEIEQFLPNETLGVLRSGNLPPTAAGQPINPDPNLINFCVSLHYQGDSDEQIIAILLTSPTYYSRVAYYKGILRSPGIRD